MIVDAHAHFGQWLSSTEEDTPERFSALLDRFNIDISIVSSGRAIQYEIVSGNAETARLMESDKRVYGAVVVNPNHREASLAELSRWGQDERFVAVKLHPDYCGVPADSPMNLAIYRRTAELGMPLVIHTWGEAGVDAVTSVARAFPALNVVMFHMGAEAWPTAVQRAREYPNLYLEIVSTVAQPEWVAEAVAKAGADRVLFGTDMTLISPAFALGLVKGAGLSENDLQRVMTLNARELFGLDRKAGLENR
ncbi:MAG: amidohydrolase family protein [Planctomycetota bacterium]